MYDMTQTFYELLCHGTKSNQINEEYVHMTHIIPPLAYNVIKKRHYPRMVKYTPSKLALDLCCMVHFN